MLGIGFWEWVVIFSIVMLLFGRDRVASLAEELGKSVKAFKKGMRSVDCDSVENGLSSRKNASRKQKKN